MSKYTYFSVHDLKDLAAIYENCDDYKVKVWDPILQKEGQLNFTGSDNSTKEIHFNVTYNNDENLIRTFNEIVGEMKIFGLEDTSINWEEKFLKCLIKNRNEN